MIRILTKKDADAALEIVKGVTIKMIEMGIDQWDEQYPTLNDIHIDISKKDAFGFFSNDQLTGYVIFNHDFDLEYNAINWLNKNNDFLVMHRLSVHPNFQGKGIAKQLIQFGETLVVQNNLSSLRFDAFTKNTISNTLYEKIGYKNLGTVTFRKGLFNCYEKLL